MMDSNRQIALQDFGTYIITEAKCFFHARTELGPGSIDGFRYSDFTKVLS